MASEIKAAGATPEPRIDHIMVLLDPAAHREVAENDFIRTRFCRQKGKTADSSVAGRYSTLGLAGDNTLLELFGSGAPGPGGLTGGLVFSFERPGSSAAARALLDRSGPAEYHYDLVTRAMDGRDEPLPWYHLISVGLGEGSPLLLFLNEVTEDYFTAVGGTSADGLLRRRDYLDAALGTPADDSLLMRDITGATLLVRPERARRIAAALTALGYAAAEAGDEVTLRGHDFLITLKRHESAPERILEVRLRISGWDGAGRVLEFGDSVRLSVESDGTARWNF